MNLNPMMLMQLKGKVSGFTKRHPKFKMFCADVFGNFEADDIFEISVTKADGRKIKTNIKITAEDSELFKDLTSIIK